MSKNSSNKSKRDGSVELKVCVICNSRCGDILHEGRERGLAKLKKATNARRNAPDDTSYNEEPLQVIPNWFGIGNVTRTSLIKAKLSA